MARLIGLIIALLLPMIAAAQPVQQSGTVTPGHATRWVTSGAVADGGPASGAANQSGNYLTELGITRGGLPFCINDGLISGPYHQLCLGANSLGGGLLSYQAQNGAASLPFECNVNGQTQLCFGAISGLVTVQNNAALKALTVGQYSVIYREGALTAGDGGQAVYIYSQNACSLNSGAGDDGSQVQPTTGGGCWIASLYGAANLKVWGATGNGSTNDGPAVQAWLNYVAANGAEGYAPPGNYASNARLAVTSNLPIAIRGAGAAVTTFTFSGPTDGLAFQIGSGSSCGGGFVADGFTITRGPTSPTFGNTALNVFSNPTTVCDNPFIPYAISNVVVRGPGSTTGWNTGFSLTGVFNTYLSNLTVYSDNNDGTNHGDCGIAIQGTQTSAGAVITYSAGVNISNTVVQGGSTAYCIGPWVQGVSIVNGGTEANYNGVYWNTDAAPVNAVTTADAPNGTSTLTFAPSTVAPFLAGDFISGTGVPAWTQMHSINYTTGTVSISTIVTTQDVPSGTTLQWVRRQGGENLTMSGTATASANRGVYLVDVGLVNINNGTFLYSGNAGNWIGVDVESSPFATIAANNCLALGGSNLNCVVVNNNGQAATTPVAITGNTMFGGSYVAVIEGGSADTTATGNSCTGCAGAVHDTTGNPNTVGFNNSDGNPQGYFDSVGALNIGSPTASNGSFNLDAASGNDVQLGFEQAGLATWNFSGKDDMIFGRYQPLGTLNDIPFIVFRTSKTDAPYGNFNGGDLLETHAIRAANGLTSGYDTAGGATVSMDSASATPQNLSYEWNSNAVWQLGFAGSATPDLGFGRYELTSPYTLQDIPLSISVATGLVTITDGLKVTGLPTSCSGKPTGTIWNNANVLNVCP